VCQDARLPKHSIARSLGTAQTAHDHRRSWNEFTGRVRDDWAYQRGVLLDLI
jgi:hypothetical protein